MSTLHTPTASADDILPVAYPSSGRGDDEAQAELHARLRKGDDRALKAIIRFLQSSGVTPKAIDAAAYFRGGDQAIADVLASLAVDGARPVPVRLSALKGLVDGKKYGRTSLEACRQVLRESGDKELRYSAVAGLNRARELPDEAVGQAVDRELIALAAKDSDPKVRAAALSALCRRSPAVLVQCLKDRARFVEHLLARASDSAEDAAVRKASVSLLGSLGEALAPEAGAKLLALSIQPSNPPKARDSGARSRWRGDRHLAPDAVTALKAYPQAILGNWTAFLGTLSDVSSDVRSNALLVIDSLVPTLERGQALAVARSVGERFAAAPGNSGEEARVLVRHPVLYEEPVFAAWMAVVALKRRDIALQSIAHLPADHVRDLLLDASERTTGWLADLLEAVAATGRPNVVSAEGIVQWAGHPDQRVRLVVLQLLNAIEMAPEAPGSEMELARGAVEA